MSALEIIQIINAGLQAEPAILALVMQIIGSHPDVQVYLKQLDTTAMDKQTLATLEQWLKK